MEDFKCLGTTLTNQNSIQEEIKSRLMSGNACYHSALRTQCYSGDQIKKNEMGGGCSMCWGEERCIQGVSRET